MLIELFVLFRAFNILSDKKICQYIILDEKNENNEELLNYLQASIFDANKYMSQDDALNQLIASVAYTPINMDKDTGARKKKEFTTDILNNC